MKVLFYIDKLISKINLKIRFILILTALALFYNYHELIFLKPQGVHHWRQADCVSITKNYYQINSDFFSPQTHNLTSDGGRSGYNATSEIPVYYYVISLLYKLFGPHEFIYRGINTLFFLVALYFLYNIFYNFLEDFYWSSVSSLIFFTSPILIYYGNNFLTDSSAFSFAIIGIYFFTKFYKGNSYNDYYKAMLMFLLAGSFKISGLISFVAIIILYLIELLGIRKFGKGNSVLFSSPLKTIIPFVLVFIIIFSWVIYAKNYNKFHSTGYFSTGIFPLWSLSYSEVIEILNSIKINWWNQFFDSRTVYIFPILFLIVIILFKRTNTMLWFYNLIIFIGCLMYSVLWYWTFRDHDYYMLNLFVFPIITLLVFLILVKQEWIKIFNSDIIKLFVLAGLIANILHGKKQLDERYYGWRKEPKHYDGYQTIKPYLYNLGINELDTVICLPDESHFTLYLMNMRGWTFSQNNNRDSSGIIKSIKCGANYLILNGEEILKQSHIKPFLDYPIGQYKEIKIFSLKEYKKDLLSQDY